MRILLTISAIELCLFGSGQVVALNGISIRMLLYGMTLGLTFFRFKYDQFAIRLSAVFLMISILSAAIGVLNDAQIGLILNDVKPIIFFLYIVPLAHFMYNQKNIELLKKVFSYCGIILAGIYLVYYFFLSDQLFVKFIIIYLESIGELFRRSEVAFIYKSFLVLVFSFYFIIYSKMKLRWVFAAIVILACVLTFTRGYILALLGSFFLLSAIEVLYSFRVKLGVIYIAVVIAGVLAFNLPAIIGFYGGDKEKSDSTRYLQIEEVTEMISPNSILIGHGFGIGTEHRQEHMEIAFLEIFHKQGVIGLLFWVGLLFLSIWYYLKSKERDQIYLKPFMLTILAIYVISLTNPYINNSIGLFPFLSSLLVLKNYYDKNFGMHSDL